MKTLIKENNGGGLSLEHYDDNGNILSVVSGLEYASQGNGIEDVKSYGIGWDWTDCGGNIVGYGESGNTSGDRKMTADGDYTDDELTAADMIDDSEYTMVVAEWDGKEFNVYDEYAGHNASSYFGIQEDD